MPRKNICAKIIVDLEQQCYMVGGEISKGKIMGRIDLQEGLLEKFREMQRGARAASISHKVTEAGYLFHDGRASAFRDCIRELEKAIEEAK